MKTLLAALVLGLGSATAWGQTTATQTTFTATSADNIGGDTNVSYTTDKGGGTSNPAISGGVIRLYQNSAGTGGGSITVSVAEGYYITAAAVGSDMNTSVAYSLDGSSDKSETSSLSSGNIFSINGLNASSVTFHCMGTDKSHRLYVNHLSVTYEAQSATTPDAPTFSLPGGTYFGAQTVELTQAASANIYYTKDGTDPREGSGTLYSSAIYAIFVNIFVSVSSGVAVTSHSIVIVSELMSPVPVYAGKLSSFPDFLTNVNLLSPLSL